MKLMNKRINIVTLLLFLLITLFVYLILLTPMIKQQQDTMVENFELNALNQYQVAEQFTNKIIGETMSLSSRSVIRNALVQYQSQEIDWQTLYNITNDKYKDGVNVIDHFEYAARIVNDKVLVEIGDSAMLRDVDLINLNNILIKYNPNNNTIIVKNPIFDHDNLLGYDVLCVNMMPILEKIKGEKSTIWIETGVLEDITIRQDGMVTVGKSFNSFDATFYTQLSEDVLFSHIRKTQNRIFLFFSVVLIGTYFLLYMVVVKYAKNMVKQIEESKNAATSREQENLQLIKEMNKGFVIFKAIDCSDDNRFNYKVLDTNRTFEDMIEMNKNDIIGKNIFEIFPMIEEHLVNQLDGLIDDKNSVSFQVYVDYMDKWYQFSAYIPRKGHLAMMIDDITENILIQNQLAHSEEQMRVTLHIIGEGIWEWNINNNQVKHNDKLAEIFGFDISETKHTVDNYYSYLHPEDYEIVHKRLNDAIKNKKEYYSEHRIIRRDGRILWVLDRGILVTNQRSDDPIRMIGSILDISLSKKAEEALSTEKETLKTTLLSVGDGVIATNNNMQINFINHEAEKITGWQNKGAQGKALVDVLRIFDEETQELIKGPFKEYVLYEESNLVRQITLQSKDGKHIPIQGSISPIQIDKTCERLGFVIAFRDITEQRKRQKEIEELGFNDYLTGLYNRRYMEDSMKRLDTNRHLPLTIMILDINGLKKVNDKHGHEAGDDLIKAAAESIKSACRSEDIVARIGGDEFMILLPNTTAESAERIKQRINTSAKDKHIYSNSLSLAIGYSVKAEEAEDIRSILKCADKNMYEDKLIKSKE